MQSNVTTENQAPKLTSRDIRALLAYSGRIPRADSKDWFVNSAGFLVNDRYGSGLLDVSRLVSLAANWKTVGPLCIASRKRNPVRRLSQNKRKTMQVLLKNCRKSEKIYAGQTATFTFNIPKAKGYLASESERKESCMVDSLEIVTIHMQWVHKHRGHLQVTLVSPGGMTMDLLKPRKLDHFSGSSEVTWKSVMNFGEAGSGKWKVLVTDTKNSTKRRYQTGCVSHIQLQLHGTEEGEDSFSKNQDLILPHWTELQKAARNSEESHRLDAEETATVYDYQRWDALETDVPPKSTGKKGKRKSHGTA
ncbi:unnamed protein product [Dibothriocephalus latus]|uniref:P/Homo B domain-containing protein n=1 Tax=Dibothriocephalus latus TaxID=60516 RepID=A0A3P7NYE4_DIBLA|nr:unnamed protein product [Dibothriocephalus latus]